MLTQPQKVKICIIILYLDTWFPFWHYRVHKVIELELHYCTVEKQFSH